MEIGTYQKIEKLSEGAFGEVWKAHPANEPEEVVALKILKESRQPESLKKEAQTLSQLDHPGIVPIRDYQVDSAPYFLVMDYCSGRSLREILDDEGKLSPERSIQLAQKILTPLNYLHSEGFVHGDLKPENIFLTKKEELRLIDFGLSRVYDPETLRMSLSQTMQKAQGGTLHYLAPEVLEEGKITPRADLFALGIVLYEMIVGYNHPLDKLRSITPESLRELIKKAVHPAPQKRFASAEELNRALEEMISGKEKEATSIETVSPSALWEANSKANAPSSPPRRSTPYKTARPPLSSQILSKMVQFFRLLPVIPLAFIAGIGFFISAIHYRSSQVEYLGVILPSAVSLLAFGLLFFRLLSHAVQGKVERGIDLGEVLNMRVLLTSVLGVPFLVLFASFPGIMFYTHGQRAWESWSQAFDEGEKKDTIKGKLSKFRPLGSVEATPRLAALHPSHFYLFAGWHPNKKYFLAGQKKSKAKKGQESTSSLKKIKVSLPLPEKHATLEPVQLIFNREGTRLAARTLEKGILLWKINSSHPEKSTFQRHLSYPLAGQSPSPYYSYRLSENMEFIYVKGRKKVYVYRLKKSPILFFEKEVKEPATLAATSGAPLVAVARKTPLSRPPRSLSLFHLKKGKAWHLGHNRSNIRPIEALHFTDKASHLFIFYQSHFLLWELEGKLPQGKLSSTKYPSFEKGNILQRILNQSPPLLAGRSENALYLWSLEQKRTLIAIESAKEKQFMDLQFRKNSLHLLINDVFKDRVEVYRIPYANCGLAEKEK